MLTQPAISATNLIPRREMIRRYVSHIPARHFKMIRYYGF
ncbi:transposase [Providencia rettgeri]|uniref:Transposase n=1 Tax=Providencia rettgeri TaxID=587 RepID=A0A939NAM9_PRORE|nr:transposase [Providencia rettgeri]